MKRHLSLLLVIMLLLGGIAVSTTATTGQAYEVGYSKVDINPYWYQWLNWTGNPPAGIKGVIPYDFYDEYDLMPLPMGGYGENEYRLSRPKLMDDNGSGVGAGKTNVTTGYVNGTKTTLNPDKYYKDVYLGTGSQNKANKTAQNYQDVHLSSNRYTKELAAEMGVTYEDGKYGENDGDGVWVNAVAIKDPQSTSPLIIISVDNIGVPDSLINDYIKPRIVSAVKGMSADRILVNSNHTHGSVSLGSQYSSSNTTNLYYLADNTFGDNISFTEQQCFWYLNFYKNFIIAQVVESAKLAVADMETALTMEKGTIDASKQSGYQLNGVRHNVQTYDGTGSKPNKSPITYVRGSSFNNDIDPSDGVSYDTHLPGVQKGLSGSTPVTESDDSLHILKFTFKNKAPIAMVNFRAHSTANNKEAAKALHYNISADWVSPLRYELEKQGYRFSLLYGSSGNLGTGVSSNANKLIPYDQAYYSKEDGYWVMPATHYGRKIAEVALALLGDLPEQNRAITSKMRSVEMGKILNLQNNHSVKSQEISELAYAAALKYYATNSSGGKKFTFQAGTTVTYEDASITLTTGGSYVIASKYHANSVKNRYNSKGITSVELNTILLGNSVAFATTPIEASDRYFTQEIASTKDILSTASKYNDWNNLVEKSAWGTPFVLSLTNGSKGYIPNQLAYDYNKDYTGNEYTLAIGSYESQTAPAGRGEGERIVATLNNMLRNLTPKTAYCQQCKAEKTWLPLGSQNIKVTSSTSNGTTTKTYTLNGGHYYLVGDYTYNHQLRINSKVCLDLNGSTFTTRAYNADSRAFTITSTLSIMDSSKEQTGRLEGTGVMFSDTTTEFNGGSVIVNSKGTLNLFGGTISQNIYDGYGATKGGAVYVEGTLNMYGGGITGGRATNGANIYIAGGKANIYGGTIADGVSTSNGGNIFVSKDCTLLVDGGEIKNGRAETAYKTIMGGNIYSEGTVTISGGNITGGYAQTSGGNIHVQNSQLTMTGGSITNGTALNGNGNDLCVVSAGTIVSTFRMEGGYIDSAYVNGSTVLTGPTGTTKAVNLTIKEPEKQLKFEGAYTGMLNIIPEGTSYSSWTIGSKIAAASNADISEAYISLSGHTDKDVAVDGNKIVLAKPTLSVRVGLTTTNFDSVTAAVSSYNKTEGAWLVLNSHNLKISGVTKDLQLDLNGKTAASVDTGAYRLICIDSATDDYSTPGPGSYGSIPGNTAATTLPGYLAITQDERLSFHRFEMDITTVNVRPREAGIYYTCVFKGDEAIKSQVKTFGVALSVGEQGASQINKNTKNLVYLSKEGSMWTPGVGDTFNSVLIRNIMRTKLSTADNQYRGELKVNGATYVTLNNGTQLFGTTYSYSLRDVLEIANDTFDTFNDSVLSMYKDYEPVMSQWDLDRIKAALK